LLARLSYINPQWKLIVFIMSIIVGTMRHIFLPYRGSKCAWLRKTNNYINVVNVSLFHHKYNIDLEKCKIQSSAQQKERGMQMRLSNRIKKLLHLVTWLTHLSREQICNTPTTTTRLGGVTTLQDNNKIKAIENMGINLKYQSKRKQLPTFNLNQTSITKLWK
jgi:hypothetical protein